MTLLELIDGVLHIMFQSICMIIPIVVFIKSKTFRMMCTGVSFFVIMKYISTNVSNEYEYIQYLILLAVIVLYIYIYIRVFDIIKYNPFEMTEAEEKFYDRF